MEVWRGRRLMTAALVFIVSFSLCAVLPFSVFALTAGLAGLIYALWILAYRKKRKNDPYRFILPVFLALALLAGAFCSARYRYILSPAVSEGEEGVFYGTVKSVEEEKPYCGSYLLLLADEKGRDFLCLAESDTALGFSVGDGIKAVGTAEKMTDTYYLSDNVRVFLSVSFAEILSYGEGKLPFFKALNARCCEILKSRLDEKAGALASAVLLGNRTMLDGQTRLDFRRIGFSHVLAVSGLHLSVLISFLSLLFRFIPVSRRIRKCILAPFVLFLVCITGAPASVLRASAMFGFVMISDLLYEEKDTVTALFCAVSSILLVNPSAFYDVGLWLSFSATLGILLFTPYAEPFSLNVKKNRRYLQWASKVGNFIVSLLVTGVCASLFTLPAVSLSYGSVSLAAPLTSLLLIPLVTVLLPVFLLILLLGWIPGVGTLLSFAADGGTQLLLWAAGRLSDTDGIYLSLSYPFVPFFVAALTLILLLLFFTKRFRIWMALACTVCLCAAFGLCVNGAEQSVWNTVQTKIENTEKNDALVLRYHGSTAVVDVTGGSFACGYRYTEAVYDLCDDRIDALVFTHLHSYHAQTLKKLCSYIKIDAVFYPAPETETEKENAALLLTAAKEMGIRASCYYENASVSLDDVTVSLPPGLLLTRSTHPVVTFSVSKGEKEVLRYLGAGLCELPAYGMPEEEECAVLFGSHGPKRKRNLAVDRPFIALGAAAEFTEGEKKTELSNGTLSLNFSD